MARSKAWIRAYGSERRVAWVSLQQCIVWGCFCTDGAPSHNAHVSGPIDGRPVEDIVPLCNRHHCELDGREKIPGVEYLDYLRMGLRERFESHYELNLRESADAVEALWQKLNPEEKS